MGLEVDEIARLVGIAEPPVCPLCSSELPWDWAAASVVTQDETGEEAVIISYHCSACDVIIHTFA